MKSSTLILSVLLSLYTVLGITVASSEAATLNITVKDALTGNPVDDITVSVVSETDDSTRRRERFKWRAFNGRVSRGGPIPLPFLQLIIPMQL